MGLRTSLKPTQIHQPSLLLRDSLSTCLNCSSWGYTMLTAQRRLLRYAAHGILQGTLYCQYATASTARKPTMTNRITRGSLILCFVLFVLCFCTVSFMYIYPYLFCLYWCSEYCHRVTTEVNKKAGKYVSK
jgi:hypothetical protein